MTIEEMKVRLHTLETLKAEIENDRVAEGVAVVVSLVTMLIVYMCGGFS